MVAEVMAVLAEVRHLLGQQFVVPAAVRFVASSAVFLDRRVFPHKRPAFLSVAGVAQLISAIGSQHAMSQATVRVVAVST